MKDGSAPEEFGPTHPTVRDIRREHWGLVHRVERLERRQFGMVQVTALVALIAGLFLPFMTDEDGDLGDESLSLLSLIVRLFTDKAPEGHWITFGVLPAVWGATVVAVVAALLWFAGERSERSAKLAQIGAVVLGLGVGFTWLQFVLLESPRWGIFGEARVTIATAASLSLIAGAILTLFAVHVGSDSR
ncbi:hypothetical protein [Enemella evansiae]|uniref:hypothetical protein n=1 Tax=Enemella evansiae TaxID=2016499 RepID=UPI00105BE693|nr:hypothetical protein [Enemella evansiae]TDO91893.1 hypothetical protein C8D81_2208 [Enemella evansiae]